MHLVEDRKKALSSILKNGRGRAKTRFTAKDGPLSGRRGARSAACAVSLDAADWHLASEFPGKFRTKSMI